MATRLGDLLVQRGVLSPEQRDLILEEQAAVGRPFGELAERLFGVDPSVVESAWAEQYGQVAEFVNPAARTIEPFVLSLIDRRQAWQFRVLPIELREHELILCTTKADLPRAMKFALWKLGHTSFFVLCHADQLAEALTRHYPMAGLDASWVTRRVAVA